MPMLLLLAVASTPVTAAEVDVSKLPLPATRAVDFEKDIKPILDAACLKCHGPEKPKSKFRIDDRAAMLKGGDSGVSVIPGDSAKSSFIHYVARLVPDMEMPPAGKGEPLTAEQVGLLRAWIDQDAPWGDAPAASKTIVEVAPAFRWTSVEGDERKFRELTWRRDGWDGGLEHFYHRDQLDPNRRFEISGHLFRDDVRVRLSLDRTDGVFLRAGFEQFRKWFDDSGGYYAPYGGPLARLDRDLYLDLGKAWIEAGGVTAFGLQLKGGYEYHFKDGEKSLTAWQPTGPVGDPKSILPASKAIDEQLHVLRLDAALDYAGVRFEDRLRFEHYDLTTGSSLARWFSTDTSLTQRIIENQKHNTLANAFTAEAQPREWLLVSAGHLYTRTDGDSDFRMTPVDAAGTALPGGPAWNAPRLTIEQHAHVFNANAQLTLWEQTTLSAGAQAEWNRQRVFGAINLDEVDLTYPNGLTNTPGRGYGDFDRFTAEEKFLLRNTEIPFTVLYGEARFRQETVQELQGLDAVQDLSTFNHTRETDVTRLWQLYRAGFQVSPWSRISAGAHYQWRYRDDTFDHDVDLRPFYNDLGYPGFITARETTSDEAGARLAVRPATWLKTTLTYRWVETDFETATQTIPTFTSGGSRSGEHTAHQYGLSLTLTPWRRWHTLANFTVQDSRTDSSANGNPSIASFRGQVYSAMLMATYLLNDLTDVTMGYDFSHADYTQPNVAAGLPLGIDYETHGLRAGIARSLWKRVKARLEYSWTYYDEPSGGNYNDFIAHGVFGSLAVRWD